ncbi:phosphatidylcholine/phosphatidylserine synthase [Pacificimonas sp. WHA3]|uniref:Phosphatidylcholine/phosphatidylserine synthase n=1 Tax=Pacificimonas pallii TaxID=2827236 RepID=A0ABS6SGQ9_9SPHN|nr:phosphatidylcholine/phosphatidylserine synthase [Pacificimonas pallii]
MRTVTRVLPIRALIPNAITLAALCSGLTAVRFAITGEFEKALLAIFLAGVLDVMDGRIARMLKGSTRFGAELDSLSDNAAFGVAPALIIYFWILQELPAFGWIVALAHAVCAALRLARFNAQLDVDDQPHKKAGFLTGVPAPVGAGLTLSPMFLFYWLEPTDVNYPAIGAGFTAIVTAMSAFLMVSNLPTYSWKSVNIPRGLRLFALVAIAMLLGALLSAPFMTLSIISLGYAATIPFSIRAYARAKRREAVSEPPISEARPDALANETQGDKTQTAESGGGTADAEPIHPVSQKPEPKPPA